ncbi:MAG: hypothetical protein ACM3IJ_06050 [Candidatus Levyibacteriota bacterium]
MSKERFKAGLRKAAVDALYLYGITGTALSGWGLLDFNTARANERLHSGIINGMTEFNHPNQYESYALNHIEKDKATQKRGEVEIIAGVAMALPTVLAESKRRGEEIKKDGGFKKLLPR